MDGFHDTNPNGTVGGNNLPTVDRVFRRRTYSEELGETAVLSPSVHQQRAPAVPDWPRPITEFDPVIYGTQYQVPISAGGTFTTGTSQSALLMNRQYQFSDTLSAIHGRHQLKFGADVLFAHNGGNSKEFGGPIYLGQFVYNTCTQALCGLRKPGLSRQHHQRARLTRRVTATPTYTVDDTLWSLFVQDDYPRPPRSHHQPRACVTSSRPSPIPARISRRASASPTTSQGDGKTVIRGGFGIYYSQIVDNSAANWALTGPTGVFNYTAGARPGRVPDQRRCRAAAGVSGRRRGRRCAASTCARAIAPI